MEVSAVWIVVGLAALILGPGGAAWVGVRTGFRVEINGLKNEVGEMRTDVRELKTSVSNLSKGQGVIQATCNERHVALDKRIDDLAE